jgi:hypothetical protein
MTNVPLPAPGKFKTVSFFATKYVSNLVDSLSQLLKTRFGLETTQVTLTRSITEQDVRTNENTPTELMFILIPHLLVTSVSRLPPPGKYVIYQLEQLNDKGVGNLHPKVIFNDLFCRLIRQSLVAFDYTSINVGCYPDSCKDKVRVLTPPIKSDVDRATTSQLSDGPDVLFYGSMNSRRNIIIGNLTKQLNARGHSVKVVHGLFGEELLDLVAQSKVVLNIHFYENSILESDRIHTALQFPHVRIVSEYPTSRDETTTHLYESHPRILFCSELRDYSNCDPTINVNLTDELFKTCLKALASFDNGNGNDNSGLEPVCQTMNEMCTEVLTKILL